MESSTSKIAANVLIVIALLLIGASLVTVFNKKVEVVAPTVIPTPAPVIIEQSATNTPIESTTTDIVSTSTSTATSTNINIAGFTEKNWTWVKTTTGSKTVTPKKAEAFTVTFKTNGSLSGTTDCNSFFGDYNVASDTLSFGGLGSTRMFCEGAQETDFMKALQEAKSYMVDKSNNLILITASGSMMFK